MKSKNKALNVIWILVLQILMSSAGAKVLLDIAYSVVNKSMRSLSF